MLKPKRSIEQVDFEVILPIWNNYLWPERKSEIKPMSCMTYDGGYDISIYEMYSPSFFAVYENGVIIGVNSCHRTQLTQARSRGIWVNPEYRNQGVAGLLFNMVDQVSKKEKCTEIWSLPRKSALPAYEKYGYVKTSDFITEGVEFGPNCYVCKSL
jgi:GNAT superfamily N-acetyltransferase